MFLIVICGLFFETILKILQLFYNNHLTDDRINIVYDISVSERIVRYILIAVIILFSATNMRYGSVYKN